MTLNKKSILLIVIALSCVIQAEKVDTKILDLTTFGLERYETPIDVIVGQHLQIILQENPTTGYEWEQCNTQAACDILTFGQEPQHTLKFIGSSTSRKSQSSNQDGSVFVGVGGSHTFEFEVVEAGQSDLHFINKRSWEVNAVESKSVRIISVQ
ncbi:UNKNOWN [Stylonychia lemnae]|uniref:Proteinase inhibitor I42 chagasin domain-containing protein n=1 Tax=Stylonychia lemnae TaxID=5949 RepID=A0A078B094_STYLE|nr:UNKNOWN [Stylonychia lemnae]|eukprot:CDW87914.1 UNKNOWN [Stylonychia lemnae]